VRDELSPYFEFADMDVEKANLAMQNILRLKSEIHIIQADIRNLEKKLR
jgi:hypothetical protein